jgi:hypothetical protein
MAKEPASACCAPPGDSANDRFKFDELRHTYASPLAAVPGLHPKVVLEVRAIRGFQMKARLSPAHVF